MNPATELSGARRLRARRWFFSATCATLVLGAVAAAPYLPADQLRGPLQAELERVLGRRVEMQGRLRLRALPQPGITAANIVVHEDPRFGPEPFLYADAVSFDIAFSSLWKGRLRLREITAAGASLNLMKSGAGAWNLEPVLRSFVAMQSDADVRGMGVSFEEGRINVKTADRKHVVYLSDVDLHVEPSSRQSELVVRVAGSVARTDRPAHGFARLSGRGRVNFLDPAGGRVAMSVALERTAVSDLLAATGRTGPAVEGFLSCSAQVQGDLSRLEIKGRMQLQETQRWAWLWPAGAAWGLDFTGLLDLANEEIEFRTPLRQADPVPFSLLLRLRNYWQDLTWGSIVVLEKAPLQSAAHLASQLGLKVPEGLQLEGELTGAIGYSPGSGFQGMVRAEAAKATSSRSLALELPQPTLSIAQDAWRIAKTPAVINGHEGITVEVRIGPAEKQLTLEMESSGAPLGDAFSCWQSLAGTPPPPALADLQNATWRGSLRYSVERDLPGRWDGDLVVKDAEWRTPLFRQPVTIKAASFVLRGANLQVESLQGQLGETMLAGRYRFLESARYPHRLRFALKRLNYRTVTDWFGKLAGPETGLFGRAFHIGGSHEAATPLGAVEAELTVEELVPRTGAPVKNLTLRCFLEADQFRVQQFSGEWSGGKVSGDLEFRAKGGVSPILVGGIRWEGVNWGSRTMEGEAAVTERASGQEPLHDFRAEGWFRILAGSGPEGEEVGTVTGCFLSAGRSGRPEWFLDGVSAMIGGERYTGSGRSLPNGRLQLDLSNGVKLIRLTGSVTGQEQDLIRIQK